jgi:hypothetical protein
VRHGRQSGSRSEFKAKALEFFRQIEATGESVIVTDYGKPAFEVRPYRVIERNPLDVLRGSVLRYASLTDPVEEGDCKTAQQLVQSFVDEQKG